MNIIKACLVLACLAASINVKAEILFEGYYKVVQFKKHIGFVVLRHEIDEKTKNFKTTSFTKLAKSGFDFTESYQVVSTTDLAPVSLSYLSAGDKQTKTIDVKFKDQKITGSLMENGKKSKVNEKYSKGAFMASALYYVMLRSKDGLKTDTKLDYSAITEEGPVDMKGTVTVDKKMVTQGALQLLKINNKFAASDYDSLVTVRGEVIAVNTPATGIESELVKNKEDATEGIKMAPGTLEKIFGSVPAGTANVMSRGK